MAGGQGKRMNSETPKQFLNISGKPLLMHSIECFFNFSSRLNIILVLPKNHFNYWNSLCNKYGFSIPHQIVPGGKTRFQSVLNGLNTIKEDCIVAIHDGVRPLVSGKTIANAFDLAEIKGNAIPVCDIYESMRRIKDEESLPVNRMEYKIVQTPQCFHSSQIKLAYSQEYKPEFTDDSTVVESMGIKVHLTEGNRENIKITHMSDLKIARSFL